MVTVSAELAQAGKLRRAVRFTSHPTSFSLSSTYSTALAAPGVLAAGRAHNVSSSVRPAKTSAGSVVSSLSGRYLPGDQRTRAHDEMLQLLHSSHIELLQGQREPPLLVLSIACVTKAHWRSRNASLFEQRASRPLPTDPLTGTVASRGRRKGLTGDESAGSGSSLCSTTRWRTGQQEGSAAGVRGRRAAKTAERAMVCYLWADLTRATTQQICVLSFQRPNDLGSMTVQPFTTPASCAHAACRAHK